MPDSKYYVAGAFLSGIALTVAYNRHLSAVSSHTKSQDAPTQQHKLLSRLIKINDLETLKKTLVELESSLVKGEGGDDIKEGIEGCIGNTPLIRIKSLSEYTGCDILVKAEFLNGAGNSPKDRVALSIIEMAEERGLLVPNSGDTVYEGTVGSTGISLAAICRARGYKAHM
ncbi:hypothetical protein G6514_006074 [Epicoccum nigrum]|nr:hypothetical protein G6514_006074 [Epicoccum nigrum]